MSGIGPEQAILEDLARPVGRAQFGPPGQSGVRAGFIEGGDWCEADLDTVRFVKFRETSRRRLYFVTYEGSLPDMPGRHRFSELYPVERTAEGSWQTTGGAGGGDEDMARPEPWVNLAGGGWRELEPGVTRALPGPVLRRRARPRRWGRGRPRAAALRRRRGARRRHRSGDRVVHRRYFHRRRGVTALTTTSDHHLALHTVVVPGTQPDALYLLDGLTDPQTSVRPREIMTDTAGYTDVIFGLFRLLGYQFSPRLADAGGARFWRLDARADYGPLNRIARHRISPGLIAAHYDDLLRVAGSLLQRHTTASQLMRALRSHTRHLTALARAIAQVGRAAKTIHLLDYCNDDVLRRRILAQLNRGESRHALSREVFHRHRGELRQHYHHGQEEQLTALGLIVNCIALYNTIYTQRALSRLADAGHAVCDEDVERLSPLGHEHITLTGRYRIALPDPLRDRSAYRPLKTPALDAAAA